MMQKDQLPNELASETISKIGNKATNGQTKIIDILEGFQRNGILLAMVFFALPIAIPLPYPPGFTTIMGLPLLILSIQMLMGSTKINLTRKINEYEISDSTLKMISNRLVPLLRNIERYIKPRFSFVSSWYCIKLVAVVCIIASITIMMPLFMTNAIPAQGIVILSIGLMNKDGIAVITGLIVAIIGIIIALFMLIASLALIKYVFGTVF